MEIVRLEKEHLPAIHELVRASFPKASISLDEIERVFNTPAGFAIGFIGFDGVRPTGYYGVFPTLIHYEGETELAAQSGYTMVHPDYRGGGLFTVLLKSCYKTAGKEINFIFGFPNENSKRGLENIGWTMLEPIKFYRARPIPFPIVYKKLKCHLIQRNGVLRDWDYQNYKGGEIVKLPSGIAWIKKKNGILTIGDCWEVADTGKFIAELRRLAFMFFCRKVNMISLNEGFNSQIYNGYYNFNSRIPIENLTFTIGDFDTF